MDILSIIKENLPDEIQISDKNLNIIAKEIKRVQGEEFVPKTAYAKQSEKLIDIEGKLSEMSGISTDIETYKNRIQELENSIETIKAEHKTAMDTKTSEFETFKLKQDQAQVKAKAETLIKKQLLANGAKNDDLILEALANKIGTDSVEIEGDSIKNWDSIFAPIKETYSTSFGDIKTKGVDVHTPPNAESGEADPFLQGFDEN